MRSSSARRRERTRRRRLRERVSDARYRWRSRARRVRPFPDVTIDAVVCTLIFCTVADQQRALAEIHRVLPPGGRLAVLEHVRDEGRHARRQRRIEPLWRTDAGCHLTRETGAAIRALLAVEEESRFVVPPRWNPTSTIMTLTAVR